MYSIFRRTPSVHRARLLLWTWELVVEGAENPNAMFGSAQPSSSPFGTPAFGTPSSTPAFGSSLFSTPFSSQQPQPQQQQQQQTPLFQQQQQQQTSSAFGFQNSLAFAAPQSSPFPNAQLTTQMANVAPVPFSLADRDVQVFYFLFSLHHSSIFLNRILLFNFSLINFVCCLCSSTRLLLMHIRMILGTPSTPLRYPPHSLH